MDATGTSPVSHQNDALTEARRQLANLREAVEEMDRRITPYGERAEDGTVSHYIVADSTWHRVLAAARAAPSSAAVPMMVTGAEARRRESQDNRLSTVVPSQACREVLERIITAFYAEKQDVSRELGAAMREARELLSEPALDAEASRRAALEAIVRRGLVAPSGESICCCRNINAVKAGTETACWYCELRAALAGAEGEQS